MFLQENDELVVPHMNESGHQQMEGIVCCWWVMSHMHDSCHLKMSRGTINRSERRSSTHTNESWHTYEWVMAHIRMSHVTHTNESWHTYEWVVSHIRMSHVTHTNESYHTPTRVNGVLWWVMSRMNELCRLWMDHVITKQQWMSHVTHNWVMAPMSHVTHEWVMSFMNGPCHNATGVSLFYSGKTNQYIHEFMYILIHFP